MLLNRAAPFKQTLHFLPAIQHLVLPEPFEVPVYVGMMILFAIVIAVRVRRKKQKSGKMPMFPIVILSLMLFMSIGTYPMAQVDLESSIPFVYIAFLLFSIGLFWFLFKRATSKLHIFLTYVFLFLYLGLVLFEPRMAVNNHDFSFLFGPVLQISRGVTMYRDVFVQYGFLSIIAFSLLLKTHMFNPFYIVTVVWALHLIEFFLIFIIVSRATKSKIFALITLGAALTISYFGLLSPAMNYPQAGAFRWFSCIIVLTASQFFTKITNKKFIAITAFMTLMGIDSGIIIAGGYFLTLVTQIASKKLLPRKVIQTYGMYLLSLLSLYIVYVIVFSVVGWSVVDPVFMVKSITHYAQSGYYMLPVPPYTYLWLLVFVYLYALGYYLKHTSETTLLLGTSIAFMGSLYYIGRSHPHNLFHITTLVLPVVGILCGRVYYKLTDRHYKHAFLIACLVAGVILPALFRSGAIHSNIARKVQQYKKGDIFRPELETIISQKYKTEIEWLNSEQREKPLLIISNDESYLLYLSNKKSLISQLPLVANVTAEDINKTAQQVAIHCPQRLYVNKAVVTGKPIVYVPLGSFDEMMSPQQELYDKIQSDCKGQYVVKRCNILCEIIIMK